MGKDDYYVIAGKILVYLYAKLKGKSDQKPEEYLRAMSEDFPISEEYFNYVLDEINAHGYTQMTTIKCWGGDIERDLSSIRITQEGIDFLTDNLKIRKAIEAIPMAASIF